MHAVEWIGHQQIKMAVTDVGEIRMATDQTVAIVNLDALLSVHEGGYLANLGQAILLFDPDQRLVILGRVDQWLVLFQQRLKLKRQLSEEVPGAAGVVDSMGGVALFEIRLSNADYQDKTADGHGGKELPFALLDALIEKALEHVDQKLAVAVGVDEANVLPHLQDLQQYIGVVGKEFLLNEQIPNGPLGGIRILTNKAQRVVDLVLIDAGDILAKKLAHAQLIELLYSVHQLKMAIGGNALPVKLEVVRVLDFVKVISFKRSVKSNL